MGRSTTTRPVVDANYIRALERVKEAAKKVSDEWARYIGEGSSTDGHDDAWIVGQRIRALRESLNEAELSR